MTKILRVAVKDPNGLSELVIADLKDPITVLIGNGPQGHDITDFFNFDGEALSPPYVLITLPYGLAPLDQTEGSFDLILFLNGGISLATHVNTQYYWINPENETLGWYLTPSDLRTTPMPLTRILTDRAPISVSFNYNDALQYVENFLKIPNSDTILRVDFGNRWDKAGVMKNSPVRLYTKLGVTYQLPMSRKITLDECIQLQKWANSAAREGHYFRANNRSAGNLTNYMKSIYRNRTG